MSRRESVPAKNDIGVTMRNPSSFPPVDAKGRSTVGRRQRRVCGSQYSSRYASSSSSSRRRRRKRRRRRRRRREHLLLARKTSSQFVGTGKKNPFLSRFFFIQMFRVFYWKRKPPVPFVIITQRLSDGLFFASDTNSTRKTPTKDNNAMMGGEHSSLGFVSVSSSSRLSSRAGTTGWRTRAATAHRIRLQKRGKRGGDCLVVRDRAATYGEEPAFRRKESKGGGRGRGGRGAIAFACVLVRF